MIDELKVTPGGRGGNRHPLSVRDFILAHLAAAGEDYGMNIHRAFKAELDRIARENGRRSRYHRPSAPSFLSWTPTCRRSYSSLPITLT